MTRISRLLSQNEGNGGSGGMPPFPAPAASGQDRAKRRPMILYVDNEEALVRAQMRVLRGAGYDCKGAFGFSEALEMVRQGGIDIVITDNDMENINDGIRLIKQLRQEAPRVIALLASGGIRQETWELMAAENITEALEKPVDKKTLLEKIGGLASE